MAFIALLVEGDLDESVGRHIVEYAGGNVSDVYGKQGFGYIQKKLAGFNQAARGFPILALADLGDTGYECPVVAAQELLSEPHENMLFRLVVREIESWILADRAGVARFLGVRKQEIPQLPEQVKDPKRRLVNIARTSRFNRAKNLIVPTSGSTAQVGPAYTAEMQQFVRDRWNIEGAMERAPSLKRCVRAVQRLLQE